jgi:hypothetical protein
MPSTATSTETWESEGQRYWEDVQRLSFGGSGPPALRADPGGEIAAAEPGEDRERPQGAAGIGLAVPFSVAVGDTGGEAIVRLVPGEDRLTDPRLIPSAGTLPAPLAGGVDGRQHDREEQPGDREDDEQLDEREGAGAAGHAVAVSSRRVSPAAAGSGRPRTLGGFQPPVSASKSSSRSMSGAW